MRLATFSVLVFAIAAITTSTASAAVLTGGSATFTLKKNNTSPLIKGIWQFEDYFDSTAPYNQIINWNYTTNSQNYPGNLTYGSTTVGGVEHVVLNDPIRPFGAIATPVSGRVVNNTTLQFDTDNFSQSSFLSDWSASTLSGFTVGSQGEQIGFTNMTRWKPYNSTGSLVNGDFALRYVPGRAGGAKSGLVLSSYAAGFNSTLFADLGNVSITFNDLTGTLNIAGDLLLGEGVSFWDGGGTTGANIGTFNLTAVVPEPATFGAMMATTGMTILRRRRPL